MPAINQAAVPAPTDWRDALGGAGARVTAAAALGATITVLAATGIVLEIVNGGSPTPAGRHYAASILAACLSFGLPGTLVLASGRAPGVGILAALIGLCFGLAGVVTGWAVRAGGDGTPLSGLPEAAAWVSAWCWLPGWCAIPLLLLLLPAGRLPSRRWRPVAVTAGAGVGLLTVGTALEPYALHDLPRAYGPLDNPLEAEAVGRALSTVGLVLFVPSAVAAAGSLVVRLRRSAGAQRDQLAWVALGGAVTILLLLGAFAAGDDGDVVLTVAMLPLPLTVGIAVLRHRMWDVDLVVSRALVYGALTATVVTGYVAGVSLVGGLMDDTLAGVLAVALVAVGLQPLHVRLQRRANQLVYGDRDDPAAALRRLGDRLVAAGGPDDVLPAVAETVARALRLPFVEVAVDGAPGAAHGARPQSGVVRLELLYRGERVGELSAAPREPGHRLSGADRRALDTIGRQVAVAAHAVRLTAELQASRERLVLAREEERRRLRADLHDDLGPTLAALALELESARELLPGRPDQLDAALDRAAARARDTVADVRRLVHELRPPTLDDLGLVGALEERAAQLARGGLPVAVEARQQLEPLPAAVEVAAYRIGSEALANVARHAGARSCTVTLDRTAKALELRITDDGSGIDPQAPAGVGLRSMRERAGELGGSLSIEPRAAGGTCVRAVLPLEAG